MSPLGFAACQSKKCTNRARVTFRGALVSSAPSKQELLLGGALVSSAPSKQELLQYCFVGALDSFVGALETSAPPESTP